MIKVVFAVLLISAQQPMQSPSRSASAPADTTDPYTSSSTGNAYAAGGAEIRVRATKADPRAFRMVDTKIKAEPMRNRRVRMTADLSATNVTGRAKLYLTASGPGGTLVREDGESQSITGTGTKHVDISIVVPDGATIVSAGVELRGNGDVTAKKLQITLGARVAASSTSSSSAPPASATALTAKRLLDSAITIVRTQSVWRDTISWKPVEAQIRRTAAGAKSMTEVRYAINELLKRTGDRRASYRPPQDLAGGATRPTGPSFGGPTSGAFGALPAAMVWTDERDIASIAIQNLYFNSILAKDEYAIKTHAKLEDKNVVRSCRWLIDLRNASGPAFWSGLAALKPFLGDVDAGSFLDATGAVITWHPGDSVSAEPRPALQKLLHANVAVLIGQTTTDAAENLALAFKGRENTRSFGDPSVGRAGTTERFALPDGSAITLTTRIAHDRNGIPLDGPFEPDEVLDRGTTGDAQREAAVKWLKAQKCK